jgi:adenylate cyclase class 2
MGVEIEKKYRLTSGARQGLARRLGEAGAARVRAEEFETNTLYTGHGLESGGRVLRLRRVEGRGATFTYKERFDEESAVKRRREEETEVSDAGALASILDALGYRPALVYEKRRETWQLAGAEVVLDELPFGLFVEIEGAEESISRRKNCSVSPTPPSSTLRTLS